MEGVDSLKSNQGLCTRHYITAAHSDHGRNEMYTRYKINDGQERVINGKQCNEITNPFHPWYVCCDKISANETMYITPNSMSVWVIQVARRQADSSSLSEAASSVVTSRASCCWEPPPWRASCPPPKAMVTPPQVVASAASLQSTRIAWASLQVTAMVAETFSGESEGGRTQETLLAASVLLIGVVDSRVC